MNTYAESSAVLAWLFEEPRADEVREVFIASQLIISSYLTLVECERTLRRARIKGRLGEEEMEDRLRWLTAAAEHWYVLRLDEAIIERSRLPFPAEPILTLDALHLASALFGRTVVRGLALLSLDKQVRASGAALGFEILPA